MNNWPAPVRGTMCPLKLPRCFSAYDMEDPNFKTTWKAPNETAAAYTILLLNHWMNGSGIKLNIQYDIDLDLNKHTLEVSR